MFCARGLPDSMQSIQEHSSFNVNLQDVPLNKRKHSVMHTSQKNSFHNQIATIEIGNFDPSQAHQLNAPIHKGRHALPKTNSQDIPNSICRLDLSNANNQFLPSSKEEHELSNIKAHNAPFNVKEHGLSNTKTQNTPMNMIGGQCEKVHSFSATTAGMQDVRPEGGRGREENGGVRKGREGLTSFAFGTIITKQKEVGKQKESGLLVESVVQKAAEVLETENNSNCSVGEEQIDRLRDLTGLVKFRPAEREKSQVLPSCKDCSHEAQHKEVTKLVPICEGLSNKSTETIVFNIDNTQCKRKETVDGSSSYVIPLPLQVPKSETSEKKNDNNGEIGAKDGKQFAAEEMQQHQSTQTSLSSHVFHQRQYSFFIISRSSITISLTR